MSNMTVNSNNASIQGNNPPVSHGAKLNRWGCTILAVASGAALLTSIAAVFAGILGFAGFVAAFGGAVALGLTIGGGVASAVSLAALIGTVFCSLTQWGAFDAKGTGHKPRN